MTTYSAFIQPRAGMAMQIVEVIDRFAAKLAATRRYHETVDALSQLDDRELADIGLDRMGICSAARKSANWS
ncbi:DUF1127 domain-containing protein [Seohaeicola nanhaiensis]|uniref:DUF1127 domain-containing protein n=1 Tax=Seohaeicola nanhaiensis TaxID=1387282 RepID=A0ABV9KG04_9RHOB